MTELAAGAGTLWVSQSGERLLRIDTRSNRVVATLALAIWRVRR